MREGENEVGDVRLRRNGLSDSGKKVGGSIWFVLFCSRCLFQRRKYNMTQYVYICQKYVDLSLKIV